MLQISFVEAKKNQRHLFSKCKCFSFDKIPTTQKLSSSAAFCVPPAYFDNIIEVYCYGDLEGIYRTCLVANALIP